MDTPQTRNDALTSLFEEADKLSYGSNVKRREIYEKLQSIKAANISNPEFLWRLAQICSLLSSTEEDKETQKELIFEGTKYATMALDLDDTSGDSHKWYATLMAQTAEHVGVQEKIKLGHVIKEHLETAMKLKPDDAFIYFLKGRFCLELATLSWVERKLVAMLFGDAPKSTVTEAQENFMMVERLVPGVWIENMLYIAKCNIHKKNLKEAVTWLDKAAQIPGKCLEDRMALQEIATLQSKYKTH